MAVTSIKWQYWSSGWTNASSSYPSPEHAAIGPNDGSGKYRTCISVSLGALGNAEKRNKLNFKLELNPSAAYGTKESWDNLTACCTNGAPDKSKYAIF